MEVKKEIVNHLKIVKIVIIYRILQMVYLCQYLILKSNKWLIQIIMMINHLALYSINV